MNNLLNVSGVKATVYLNYPDTIEKLASKLCQDLSLTDFDVDTDMDPPHEEFAMGEALGINLWLYKSNDFIDFNYQLKIESSNTHEDKFNGILCDISLWFSKYVNQISGIKTGGIDSVDQEFITFVRENLYGST